MVKEIVFNKNGQFRVRKYVFGANDQVEYEFKLIPNESHIPPTNLPPENVKSNVKVKIKRKVFLGSHSFCGPR